MLYLHTRDGTSSFTTMGKNWASCFLIATCTLTCAKHLQSATAPAISGTDQTLAFSATLICPQGFCKSITPIPPFLIILSPYPLPTAPSPAPSSALRIPSKFLNLSMSISNLSVLAVLLLFQQTCFLSLLLFFLFLLPFLSFRAPLQLLWNSGSESPSLPATTPQHIHASWQHRGGEGRGGCGCLLYTSPSPRDA